MAADQLLLLQQQQQQHLSYSMNSSSAGNFIPAAFSPVLSGSDVDPNSNNSNNNYLGTVPGLSSPSSTTPNDRRSSTAASHHQHQQRRQAHFVLETIRLKSAAVLSLDLAEKKLLTHDKVSDVVALNKPMITSLFQDDRDSGSSDATQMLEESVTHHANASGDLLAATLAATTRSKSSSASPERNASKKDSAHQQQQHLSQQQKDPFATGFNGVHFASEVLGASAEVQMEVDRFFETGLPLVSTDQVPDADALIVVSAGPDAATSVKMTLSAVEAATRYISHRSLSVHISACCLFGNIDEMLGKKPEEGPVSESSELSSDLQQNQQGDENSPTIAKVSMFDLLEHGGHRSHRPFALAEPCDPFFDRYTPKHLQRIGMCDDDVSDKLTQVRILAEDQLVRQFPKALGCMFFIDCIHFRDGFQRFTSDSHVTVSSQHPASSLFFSRTTVLSTHAPAIASAFVGHISALPVPASLAAQPWVSLMRHLGSETHHVLHLVASVPAEGSIGGGSAATPENRDDKGEEVAQTVLDVDDLSFDLSYKQNPSSSSAASPPPPRPLDTLEQIQAKKNSLLLLKKAFDVAAALKAAVQAGARAPIPDHIFPKRTHLKLPEYVALLRRVHDEGTNEQKTRHSFAKSALQYLASQVKGDAAVHTAMSGIHDNREKFAAIFRAAFVKSKINKKEMEKRSGSSSRSQSKMQQRSANSPPNNSSNGRNHSQHQLQLPPPPFSNINDSTSSASMLMNPGNFGNTFNLSNINIASLLAGGSFNSPDLTTKDANKLRQQNEALFLIKERLEFDLSKLDKEVKKLRGEISTCQMKRKRVERELTDSQGRQLVAEASVHKLQTEENTEILELRQRLFNMQQHIDALERKNEQLNSDIRTNSAEFDRRERLMRQDTELQFRDLRADLDVAVAEKEVLQESLEEHTGRIHALEELLVQVEVQKKALSQQLQESQTAIEAARAEARRAIDRASRTRKAEREEYMKLLESGRAATEELVTFEDLRVDRVAATAGMYRSDLDGVKKWLKMIGLEQYAPVFSNAGFRDIISVANISEMDLISLKILAGHRRKILAAVVELKTRLSVAIARRQTAPISHELATFEQLVDRQREWYRDFATVVRAEQANDDDEVFV